MNKIKLIIVRSILGSTLKCTTIITAFYNLSKIHKLLRCISGDLKNTFQSIKSMDIKKNLKIFK